MWKVVGPPVMFLGLVHHHYRYYRFISTIDPKLLGPCKRFQTDPLALADEAIHDMGVIFMNYLQLLHISIAVADLM